MINPLKRIEYHIYVIRNGAEYGEALSTDEPTITMESTAEIKKTLTANLILPDGTDMLNDTLAPRVTIDGTVYPMGEYYIGTYTEVTNNYGQVASSIEAYDGGYLPSRYRTEGIYHVSAGTKYTDAIQALLIECGVDKIIAADNEATLTVRIGRLGHLILTSSMTCCLRSITGVCGLTMTDLRGLRLSNRLIRIKWIISTKVVNTPSLQQQGNGRQTYLTNIMYLSLT